MVIKPSWCVWNVGIIRTDLKRCGNSLWAFRSIHLAQRTISFMGQSYLTNSLLSANQFSPNTYWVPIMVGGVLSDKIFIHLPNSTQCFLCAGYYSSYWGYSNKLTWQIVFLFLIWTRFDLKILVFSIWGIWHFPMYAKWLNFS